MMACATWPSCFSICWRRSPDSPVLAARVPWSPNRCSSSNNYVVRRFLAVRCRPAPDSAGPSWLTVLGHAKDGLWSLDLFRCESAVLRTHWVLVVMDHCTRRIVGFGVHRGVVDGIGLCRMFNRATRCQPSPLHLSAAQAPLS